MPEAKIPLRSVLDGETYYLVDDGYQNGDPGDPCTMRRVLERALKEKASDGLPVWFAPEPLEGWRVEERPGRFVTFDPVDAPVWDEREEKRLKAFLKTRRASSKEAEKRLAAFRPKTGPLATALAGTSSGLEGASS